jgi:hypothetical protein
MLSQFIWGVSIAVEVLLLIRMYRGKLTLHFPVFYSYILFVLLQSLLRFGFYRWDHPAYARVYWTTEFVGVVAGCAVLFEICKVALSSFPGTARMARNLLAFVCVIASAKVIVSAATNPRWQIAATNMELERALRVVQSATILSLVALFLFYSIPFGRNLRGILLGYSVFVGVSVIQLTFVSQVGPNFRPYWSYLHPISYDLALMLWAVHLWSYDAAGERKSEVAVELQYQRVAAATSRRLREARGYLERVVRP